MSIILRNQVNKIMTYEEAMAYMEKMGKKGSILGLTPIRNLLDRLHNPQEHLQVIHVAGTNGKGSICTFLEMMYRAEGKYVGRYISPTLHCYLERFQINGEYMPEETFAGLLEQVLDVLQDMESEGEELPTAFEIETAVAFLYFLEQKVDLVILETGMGGRRDATNVVKTPLCTVFASISMDHMQFLGDTVEEIALEKAGIIKAGCPVVAYPNDTGILKILRTEFDLCNAGQTVDRRKEIPVFDQVKKEDVSILSETLSESVFCYKGEQYRIRMPGTFQIFNAITAIETKLFLDGSLLGESLLNAYWEGRFEKISDKPLFIKDGAHNAGAVLALKESLEKHFTNRCFLFIIGVLKDKEYDEMVRILCPMAEKIFVVTPANKRGLGGIILKNSILPYCKNVEVCPTVADAVEQAKKEWARYEEQGKSAVITAWGSLSYIGEIKG